MELTGHFANPMVNTPTWTFLQMRMHFRSSPKTSTLDTRQKPRPEKLWHKPHLSPEQTKELVDKYLSGLTARELAESYGVHRSTVSAILNRNGVKLRRHSMEPKDIDLAVRLYESGLPLTRVAEQVSYDPSTIWREFKRIGIPRRDCQGRPR